MATGAGKTWVNGDVMGKLWENNGKIIGTYGKNMEHLI
jgi:hypothetical protein